MRTFNALNVTIKDSQSFLGVSHKAASLDSFHPLDRLSKRLEQLEWDPERINEVVCQYWKTELSFLRYEVDEETNENTTILSTSCLHTAAWVVPGLLEMQTRPNYYRGRWELPDDTNLIVYDNTEKPRSNLTAPITQSIRSFIASRPSDEHILLQVDLLRLVDEPSNYIDHHFDIHVYKGQINLYHSWQDTFTLIEWMKSPGAFKKRYPMPIDTFFADFETALSHPKDYEQRDRLEAIWRIFGTTDTFIDGPKEALDPIVRKLRYRWIAPLITHWPSPQPQSSVVK